MKGQLRFAGRSATGHASAESSRVQSYADRNGWGGGYHGAYFISSAPGATPIVAANSDFRYEPASSIKVLYLLYTLRQGVPLDSPITYYWTDSNVPDPNVCPAKSRKPRPTRTRRRSGTRLPA